MVDKLTGKNIALSTDDYNEFLRISNDLAGLFPDLVIGYDSQGNALLNLGDSAKSVTDSLRELLDAQRDLADEKILEESGKIWENVNEKNKNVAIKKAIVNDDQFKLWLQSFKYDFSKNGQTRLLSEDNGGIFSELSGDSITARLSNEYGASREEIIKYAQEVLSDIFGAKSQHGTNDIVIAKESASDFDINSYINKIPSLTEQYNQASNKNYTELVPTLITILRNQFQTELGQMSDEQQAKLILLFVYIGKYFLNIEFSFCLFKSNSHFVSVSYMMFYSELIIRIFYTRFMPQWIIIY